MKTISKVALIFLFVFNGAVILAAFIIPNFYFLNPAVIGKYSGIGAAIWGAITILAVILGFGFYPQGKTDK